MIILLPVLLIVLIGYGYHKAYWNGFDEGYVIGFSRGLNREAVKQQKDGKENV